MIRKTIIAVFTLAAVADPLLYEFLIDVIVIAVIGVLACLAWIVRRRIRRSLRRELVQRGQSVCPKCGRSLVGNVSGICPECGTKIEQP